MPEHFLVQKIPAAPASASDSDDFSLVSRDDGSMQWALKGKPLYLYAADQKPRDMNGGTVGGVWHVAHASKSKTPAASTGYDSWTNPYAY
jgi:hypothetical protein